GIVGLILHVLILLYIIFHGAYLVLFKLKNNLLKGIISALVCGLSGVYVSAYSLELIGQFPTSIIMFTCMAFIFLSPMYDKELKETEMKNINSYEPIS
ncbi:MAG: O-antigen ligase domain-containing protein, partial [Bacteroidales bacterium]